STPRSTVTLKSFFSRPGAASSISNESSFSTMFTAGTVRCMRSESKNRSPSKKSDSHESLKSEGQSERLMSYICTSFFVCCLTYPTIPSQRGNANDISNPARVTSIRKASWVQELAEGPRSQSIFLRNNRCVCSSG